MKLKVKLTVVSLLLALVGTYLLFTYEYVPRYNVTCKDAVYSNVEVYFTRDSLVLDSGDGSKVYVFETCIVDRIEGSADISGSLYSVIVVATIYLAGSALFLMLISHDAKRTD